MSGRWHQISFCFLCVVASRLILIVIGLMSQRLAGIPFHASNLFMHWDAGWYTSIVNEGYHLSQYFTGPLMGQTNVNFFPLFPGLVWPLSFVLPAGVAGQIVANGCFLLGCIVMHQFAEERFDSKIANSSSNPEEWGIWTVGKQATLAIRLPDQLPAQLELTIRLNSMIDGRNPQKVDVLVNGQKAGHWEFANKK
jgi:hypothetical protein